MDGKRHNSQQWMIRYGRWLVVLALLLVYGLLLSSAVRKSATVDEQSHLFRGVAYLREGATHFLLGHPLFASSLSALPVLTEPNLTLPLDTPAWQSGDWSVAGDAFLWRLNENPQRILFLGRLPVMWLTLLLLALVYRWGRELAGGATALIAFGLLAFDPNLLANGRIISGDIALTLFFVLTIYGYWRWAVRGAGWRGLLLAGLGLGLASVSKFNAALLLPVLGLLGLALSWRRRAWRPLLILLAVGAVGSLVIWATNGFALRPFPGGAFWDDLFWELQYFGKPHGSYLAGEYSTTGWWYYFPFAFAVKTPMPTLLLLVGAIVASLGRWRGKRGAQRGAEKVQRSTERNHNQESLKRNGFYQQMFLLLPVAIYFGVSLTSSLNIGYRYLLPTLPFLWLFTAVSLHNFSSKWERPMRWATGLVALWLALQAIFIWPDYIPFFNLLAGGPGKQWRLLSDSNIDWGQDLPALAAWQQANGEAVKLSYFGTAHPSAYGIDFEPLPMWPPAPEQAVPGRQLYDPQNPAPGIYALSVTSLHGVVLGEQRDAFAWFRQQEPLIRLGQSIFLYEVPKRGEPVELVLSGLEPAQLAPEIQARLEGNDWQVRWVNGRSAMLWPNGQGWLVFADQADEANTMRAFVAESEFVVQAAGQNLYRLSAPAFDNEPALHQFADTLILLDIKFLVPVIGVDGQEVSILTTWQAGSETLRPLKLFVHALDQTGEIIGQWDGLDVEPTSWQVGDIFVQRHQIVLPINGHPDHYLIGVYDGETLVRVGQPFSFIPDN